MSMKWIREILCLFSLIESFGFSPFSILFFSNLSSDINHVFKSFLSWSGCSHKVGLQHDSDNVRRLPVKPVSAHAVPLFSQTSVQVDPLSIVGSIPLFDRGACHVGTKVVVSHRILVLDVGYGCLWPESVLGSDKNAPLRCALRSVASANHLSDRTCSVLAV